MNLSLSTARPCESEYGETAGFKAKRFPLSTWRQEKLRADRRKGIYAPSHQGGTMRNIHKCNGRGLGVNEAVVSFVFLRIRHSLPRLFYVEVLMAFVLFLFAFCRPGNFSSKEEEYLCFQFRRQLSRKIF
jgi:hypothetical protein